MYQELALTLFHKFLDSSKVKEFADNNFKFDENGRNFSRWVENTVGKGEIACYEQFLLFPQCFQKTCTAHVKTRACLGRGLIKGQTKRHRLNFEQWVNDHFRL